MVRQELDCLNENGSRPMHIQAGYHARKRLCRSKPNTIEVLYSTPQCANERPGDHVRWLCWRSRQQLNRSHLRPLEKRWHVRRQIMQRDRDNATYFFFISSASVWMRPVSPPKSGGFV